MLAIVTARMSGRASSTQAGASGKATMVVLNVLIGAVATGPSAAPVHAQTRRSVAWMRQLSGYGP